MMKRVFRKATLIILAALIALPDFAFISGGKVYAETLTPPDNGLPVVYLDIDETRGTIEDMNTSSDHSVYCYGTLRIDAPDDFRYSDMDTDFGDIGPIDMSIRGRGNSTWTRYPKRPYKIKLDSKLDLMQRGDQYKNKHWVLIANASDPSLLKDRVTAWLGDAMGFEFTPRGVPVDVVMTGTDPDGDFYGGKYIGSYYLSENVRVDSNRLNIEELKESDTDPQKITGGYLVQNSLQVRAGSPDRFITKRDVGWATHTPTFDIEADGHALTGEIEDMDGSDGDASGEAGTGTGDEAGGEAGGGTGDDDALDNEEIFNDPDPAEPGTGGILTGDAYKNDKQQEYIQSHMQKVEDALYADGTGYRDLMDIESTAKYWLVNEFSGNHDAFGTGSTYIYKHRDVGGVESKMFWGPLWDFDYAWYYDIDLYDREIDAGHQWMGPMFYDRADGGYVQEVKKQWAEMKPLLEEISKDDGILDGYCEETERSAMADREIWKNDADTFDYRGEIDSFKKWVSNRIEWMDEQIGDDEHTGTVDNMVNRVRFVVDGETWDNLYPAYDTYPDIDPEEPVKDGYIFLGWKDENGESYQSYYTVTEDKTYTAQFVPESEATKAQDIAFGYNGFVQVRNHYVTGVHIGYTIVPEDAQDQRVEWTSSDESFATIDNNGHVTYVDKGEGTKTATFTAKLSNGVTKEFYLMLTDGAGSLPESITPEKSVVELSPGGEAPFNFTSQPMPARIDSFTYSSDDETVATVDEWQGIIKAVGPGETKVRVKVKAEEDTGDEDTGDEEAGDEDTGEIVELETYMTVKVSEKKPAPAPAPAPAPKPAAKTKKVVTDTKLPKVSIKKPARAKKAVTVKWKKLSSKKRKKIKGIEVQIKGPGVNKIVKAGKSKTSKKIKGLAKKKTYKVRVRTYKMVGKVKHVSKWSKYKKVKTK